MDADSTFFATMIYVDKIAPLRNFIEEPFDVIELRRWSNNDRGVHCRRNDPFAEPSFICMKK